MSCQLFKRLCLSFHLSPYNQIFFSWLKNNIIKDKIWVMNVYISDRHFFIIFRWILQVLNKLGVDYVCSKTRKKRNKDTSNVIIHSKGWKNIIIHWASLCTLIYISSQNFFHGSLRGVWEQIYSSLYLKTVPSLSHLPVVSAGYWSNRWLVQTQGIPNGKHFHGKEDTQ